MKPFRLIRNLLKTNLPKTIWLNFRMLPFKQAVKLPVYIYGKMIFRRMKGQLIIDSEEIHSGMIKIGKRDYYVETTVPQCIWHIEGTLILHGPMKFMQGSYVLVAGGATLEIGAGGTIFGSNFRVFCFDRITIGNNARMAWDVQIMDSSFHYTEDLNRDGLVRPLNKPVKIGDNVKIAIDIKRISVIKDNEYLIKALATHNVFVGAYTNSQNNVKSVKTIEAYYKDNAKKEIDDLIHKKNVEIGELGLYLCPNLKSIGLPESIKNIDEQALKFCDSLTEIRYAGTSDEWKNVSIGEGNELLTDGSVQIFPAK